MLQLKFNQRIFTVLSVLIFCISYQAYSQLDGKKNTVKVNITNPLIFGGKAYIFGYERVIGKNQAIGIGIGRMSLPGFAKGGGSDTISLQNNTNEKGFNLSVDYRFYLAKENKYEAPRGVYVGPYYSYNHFSRANKWVMNTSSFQGEVNTNLALSIHTFGAELGYQFVLWKRLAIDLVLIGPGMGIYNVKATIGTNLDAGDKEEFYKKLNDYLGNKIPGYDLVIGDGDFEKNGTAKTTTFGYRYMVNLGFRF
jgi:hypothetical protein